MATDLTKAWHYQNFLKYSEGTELGEVPKYGACGNGKIVSHQGNKVARTSISKGDQGWGRWGYEIKAPNMVAGDEIWWRMAMYFPTDFKFDTDHGSLKTFRIGRRERGSNKNRGATDVQIRDGGNSWRAISEYDDWPNWANFAGHGPDQGKWNQFEVYVKLGRPGVLRVWKDGKLFGEVTDRNTISANAEVFRFLLFTYWNGKSPKDQHMYFDHDTVFLQGSGHHGRQYLDTDKDGNRYIGTTVADAVTPEPPPEPEKPPVEPPVDPEPTPPPEKPPEAIEGGITLTHDKTMVHIGANEVLVTSDKPIKVS